MTPHSRRLGVVLVSSLASVAVASGALSAPAQAAPAQRDLRPVITRYQASIDACKVVRAGGKVQVFVQLDNTRNRGANARSGALYVSRNGQDTGKTVQLPLTRAGKKSKIKSITFKTGGKITIDAGIGTGAMGDGASFAFKRVKAC